MTRDGSMLFIGMDDIVGWEGIGMVKRFGCMGGSGEGSGLERLSGRRCFPSPQIHARVPVCEISRRWMWGLSRQC